MHMSCASNAHLICTYSNASSIVCSDKILIGFLFVAAFSQLTLIVLIYLPQLNLCVMFDVLHNSCFRDHCHSADTKNKKIILYCHMSRNSWRVYGMNNRGEVKRFFNSCDCSIFVQFLCV